MHKLTLLPILAVTAIFLTSNPGHAAQDAVHKARCSDFGFLQGTESFANCVLQLALQAGRNEPVDRDTRIRQYRQLSRERQGDDRYPVCGAAMMDAELDITIGKWVGPECQLSAN